MSWTKKLKFNRRNLSEPWGKGEKSKFMLDQVLTYVIFQAHPFQWTVWFLPSPHHHYTEHSGRASSCHYTSWNGQQLKSDDTELAGSHYAVGGQDQGSPGAGTVWHCFPDGVECQQLATRPPGLRDGEPITNILHTLSAQSVMPSLFDLATQ